MTKHCYSIFSHSVLDTRFAEKQLFGVAVTYRWEQCYGYGYVYAGPLFTHQLSHVWIDFRGIQDAFMREKGIDYFENKPPGYVCSATLRY